MCTKFDTPNIKRDVFYGSGKKHCTVTAYSSHKIQIALKREMSTDSKIPFPDSSVSFP
jgi:hypothetical protein